jgi:hypothetical protein
MFEGRKLELIAGKTVTEEFKFQKRVVKANRPGVNGSKENQFEKAKDQAEGG